MATPELTNIPLIIMDPERRGYHVNDTLGSQVDLLPTVLDLLGLTLPPDQLYQGASLYSPAAQASRKIYLNSFQQYGILEDRHYFLGSRETRAAISTNSLSFFAVTNDGARTAFPQIFLTNAASPSISEFDKFQANLLKNYSQYSEMIRN
jgi:arylsulfatase A-like enzyme